MSLYHQIPLSLRALPHWVLWRVTMREGKRTKMPVNARTLRAASSTDPADWCDFATTVAASTRDGMAGIGFVFTRDAGITGIDLDGCMDAAGALTPDAQALLARFAGTYVERTPSGKGLHIILRGGKPEGCTKCKVEAVHGCKQIEIYDSGRYFTFTGDRHGDATEVADCREALAALCLSLWPATNAPTLPGLPPAASKAMAKSRYMAYLKSIPEAVSGQGGHEKTLRAACEAYRFGLNDADCLDGLRWFNANKCPEGDKWTDAELEHKLRSARDKCGPGTPEFGIKLTESVPPVTAAARSPASKPDKPTDPLIPLGQRDPTDNKLVLSSKKTLPTATAYVEEFHMHADATGTKHRGLVSYADQIYEWRGNHYHEVRDAAIRSVLQPWLHGAKSYWRNPGTGDLELRQFESNDGTIRGALHAIHDHCQLSSSVTPPTWLDDSGRDFPTHELLVCRSSTLHIPTRQIIPPTPQLFATSALEFDYIADSPPPKRWLTFLNTLWSNDSDSIMMLQDWFGYLLTQDTRQQKMMLIVGPKRSGKGTIARTLQKLIGKENVAGPTTSSLAGEFGLQQLIGKSLAVISDARFSGENIASVVERLLCISGEDTLSINRKNKDFVSIRLPTRIMCLSNELPKFTDSSGALVGRFITLRLTRSFFGQEDESLEAALIEELPSILLWAIAGWERLRRRGRFIQPVSVADAMQEMEDLSSPVGAFVRECCIVGSGHRVWCEDIYTAWKSWCDRDGRTVKTTKQTFGRDLSSVAPSIQRRRSDQHAYYEGISIRS